MLSYIVSHTFIVYCNFSTTQDDIAVDWTNNKLYWTDNGFDRIGVLDSISGYYSFLIDTGSESSPRGIIVDPVNR